MTSEPVTAVEAWRLRRNWKINLLAALAALVLILFLAALVVGIAVLRRISDGGTPYYSDIVEHFKYGSIGAEPSSGIPYAIWKVLPALYPYDFNGRDDYSAFGFLYETDGDGQRRELPIGISQRKVRGVEVVWLNCATCHVIVAPEWSSRLPPPAPDEQAMLELTAAPTQPTSRLSCQIMLQPSLNGLVVQLPVTQY